MVDPLVALLVFAGVCVLGAALAWPRTGLLARVARASRLTERVLLEDAMKHVYTCEAIGRTGTLESIAGQLEVSTGKAAALLSRLTEMELVHTDEAGTRLTAQGRDSALRLVRTHRLWERYLADRTGVPAGEWHAEAERMEHTLSPAEADALAARLGHPAWDPHGDPIPTPGGELPAVERLTLAAAAPGRTVEVVHLEDEPREIYDALLADGLGLGARLDVRERSESTVRVRARGREWPLAAVVARNVSVRYLPVGESADEPAETLLDLDPGQTGRVLDISPACSGSQRRRLLDLGVVKGTEVVPELVSAGGDPVAYRIRGALVALRREQAEWIRIEKASVPAEASA
ncbi:MAG: metal-dependent transcriptional regulator [Gemmatimonadetes bacterium]|nr:metal-dependent transcriptional regulator [Gemmatimonadota bacterium]